MAAGVNERIWLEWLVKVRVIIITVLFAIELAILKLTGTNVDQRLFLTVICAWSVAAIIHLHRVMFRNSVGATESKLQVVSDLCFTTAIVYVTGGIETNFVFLYPILIIVASSLLSETWAYISAGMAFVFFGATLELSYYGLIPSYASNQPDLKTMQAVIFIYLAAFVAIAYLANKLVNRMRLAEVELQDKSFELQNLQVLNQIVVNSISSGLLTTDLEGAVRLINPAAQALLHCGPEDLTGRNVNQLFVDPLPRPGAARSEVRARTFEDAEILVGIGCSLLHATDGAVIGFIYTFTDLTHIRQLERELRLRDRLTAVGRMAAGIAHEIRNPLSSIAGSAQMLSGNAALSDDQRALLSIITRESERLNSIIDDFLAYSRDRDFHFAMVDLCRLLSDTLSLLENQSASIRIERHFFAPMALAEADGDKLKQVFWNLCSNAVRAMPDGGTLTVMVDRVDRHWCIRFQDTGRGIPPQMMEKIFEPFQSGFEGGTGLGLAIVYRIVQAHEGQIAVSSEPGRGTTFTLLFPQPTNAIAQLSADEQLQPAIDAGGSD
jgi:two-component system, NtrC family, sensor histidine kinase PilS